VQLDGEEVNAMVYIMNLKMNFGLPSPHYYQTVYEGYNDCGLNTDVLDKAVGENAKHYYSSVVRLSQQQSLFDDYNEEDYEDEDEALEDSEDDEMDESDPFYYSM